MNYYNKLINHIAFPALLFVVFGTHKDNLKLWLKKLGLKQNFGRLFKSEIDMTKVQSVREKVNVSA
jgi:hypothetical protein